MRVLPVLHFPCLLFRRIYGRYRWVPDPVSRLHLFPN